ncbi:MAG TPA: LysR substrate-binding domain-containing protein [Actinomycetes bacterium]|jgi:DNA-binding transcriptional LysR family regulator|nr:LysR substrate-binding domain-containing protein [Actinomycetes bacterium]
MLDPRRLRVLREVASRGSFSAAAAALAFTQSAVSQQVAALERETGTRLVERGVRPVRLTDAGRALLAHAEAVLARLDQAEQELGELAGLRRGRLRLASFPTAIATLVPRAVARFRERHPDVDLTVLDDHRQGLLPRLARWELDLALIYDHQALPEPGVRLERTHLLDDPFDLVVPAGHPLAARASVALGELAGQTWIGGTPDGAYARIVLHSCRAAGFEPRVVFGSDDYNAVQAFVAVGLGVALLPRMALAFPRPGVARVALAEPPVRRVAAARLAASFRSAATASMLGVLRETAAAFGASPLAAGG